MRKTPKRKILPGSSASVKTFIPFQELLFAVNAEVRWFLLLGALHADGYRGSNYSCPKRRKSGSCDNQTISDVILGEFLINYILNMLNAKRQFSKITSPDDLEQHLLYGNTFSDVDHIEECGLHEFYNLLSMYKSDDSYVISARRKKKRKAPVDPEIAALRKEKEKQERALKRLRIFTFIQITRYQKRTIFFARKKLPTNLKTSVLHSEWHPGEPNLRSVMKILSEWQVTF